MATTVTGKLNSSITGLVRAVPDHIFYDSSTTPKTLVSLPYEASITAGQFSITLPQSQNLSGTPGITTEGITYSWFLFQSNSVVTFFLLDGTQYTGPYHQWTSGSGFDNQWYTGSVNDTLSRRLDRVASTQNVQIGDTIHAIVPDSATPVDFANLVAINAAQPYLDISLYRLAELLTTVQTYKDRISTKLVPTGAYNASKFYVFGEIASFNGNSYLWKNASSLQGQTPPLTGDDANWFMMAAKGAAGGTGAQIVGWNPTSWASSSEAAARGDVKDAIASVGNIDLSQYLKIADGAPRNNPVFTGNVKRGQLSYPVPTADLPTEVPTAKYVEDAIAASAAAGRFAKPLVCTRRSANQTVCNTGSSSGTVTVVWDSTLLGASYMSNGVFTVPAAGNYIFGVCLWVRTRANNAYEPTKMAVRAFLYSQSAGELEGLLRADLRSTYSVHLDYQAFGLSYQNGLSQGNQISVRAAISYTNGASAYNPDGDTPSAIMGSVAQNYLFIWRVAD
ncbi:MAG: hypothetical protein KME30_24980 [Iphinoe sp. HA4291-MV1]|nr:hypothetical protein [Iphinoe sp. HA4291-MV1]